MKKENILYILYITIVLFSTAYLSFQIFHNKGLPLGKFILPLEKNEQPLGLRYDYEILLNLELYFKTKSLVSKEIVESFNSERFNDYEISKPNNTFRIIALGDSLTYGAWISINDSWPRQLEYKLNKLNLSNKFEVLNFGKVAISTSNEVKIFEEKALKYNPDMVILQYCSDDFVDDSYILKRKTDLWQMYKNGSFKFSRTVEEKIKELNASDSDVSAIMHNIAMSDYSVYAYQKGDDIVWKENVQNSLIKLIDICKKQKIELIVMFIDMKNESTVYKIFSDFLNKNEVPLLDLTSYFPLTSNFPVDNNELIFPDGHLSKKGYDLLSTKLLEFLIETNKISIK